MKRLTVDFEKAEVAIEGEKGRLAFHLGSPQGFEALSHAWLRAGWDAKYVYTFTWLGRPIIQLPEDLIRLQEVIWRLKPDLIVETGVAHGGSLVFHAGLCALAGKGRVIGVDIEIRPHNRAAIEAHPLFPRITLIEGSSTDPAVVESVRCNIGPKETVMVLLDSHHSKEHVLAELEAYSPLVTHGSYIVAMDGIMEQVAGAPRTRPDWTWNNPRQAVLEFASRHPEFRRLEPPFAFNESELKSRVTYWPDAYLQRVG